MTPTADAARRAHPTARGRSRSTRSSSSRCTATGGFFAPGRGAGRAGRDFVTSPEVGPLFGALRRACARPAGGATLGEPDPVPRRRGRRRAAAGSRATCSRAEPECAPRAALRARRALAGAARRAARPARARAGRRGARPVRAATDDDAPVPVDRHRADRRRARRAPRAARSTASCSPTSCSTTCRSGSSSDAADGWCGGPGRGRRRRPRRERSCPRPSELSAEADRRRRPTCPTAHGSRCPPRIGAVGCARARTRCGAVVLVVVDYVADRRRAGRPRRGRLAAHLPRATTAAASPLDAPGEQDITADVPLEYLVHAAARAGFRLELDVDPGRVAARPRHRRPRRRRPRRGGTPARHVGDLEALAGRSRVTEARRAHRSRRPRRPPRSRLPHELSARRRAPVKRVGSLARPTGRHGGR